jgi:glutamate synthase (NADPH/NADH) large chain
MSMVSLEKVEAAEAGMGKVHHLAQPDEVTLKGLIENHAKYTASVRANAMLADWTNYRSKFVKVMPNEYKRALIELAEDKALVAA